MYIRRIRIIESYAVYLYKRIYIKAPHWYPLPMV